MYAQKCVLGRFAPFLRNAVRVLFPLFHFFPGSPPDHIILKIYTPEFLRIKNADLENIDELLDQLILRGLGGGAGQTS